MGRLRRNRGSVVLIESATLGALVGVAFIGGFALFLASAPAIATRDGCVAEDIYSQPDLVSAPGCSPDFDEGEILPDGGGLR